MAKRHDEQSIRRYVASSALLALAALPLLATPSYLVNRNVAALLLTIALSVVCALTCVYVATRGRSGQAAGPIDPELGHEGPSAPADAKPIHIPDAHKQLTGLLARSENVAATLVDYVGHETGPLRDTLYALMSRAGVDEWQDAPRLGANQLVRNGRWWLYPQDEPNDADHDHMVALECILNVMEDLRCEGLPSEDDLDNRIGDIFDRTPFIRPADEQAILNANADQGEWACRMRLANYLENLSAPTRVSADFQMDVEGKLAVIDVEVERPAALGVAAGSPRSEKALLAQARSYAWRLCLLCGQAAFACAEGLTRVVVNGREHGTGYPLISMDLAPAGVETLLQQAQDTHALEIPTMLGVRFQDDASGWLEPVAPFAERTDEQVNPVVRWRPVEMDHASCSDSMKVYCGAKTYSDLGINEKAVRVDAWNEMAPNLGITTRQSVAELVNMRNRTEDLSVASACSRASEALVAGNVDATDKSGLAKLFIDGGELVDTVRNVNRRLAENDVLTPELLEDALQKVECALEPTTTTGIYLDDSKNVYRYFNSIAERVRYNRGAVDDGRKLRLVPDEYYVAHAQAAQILSMLRRPKEAMPYADELVRMAPVTVDAALTKVICLEAAEQIYEAADVLIAAIGYASNVRDLATCFYRLAYMEYKLGRGQVAVACYLRSMQIHQHVKPQVKEELAQLLLTDDSLRRLKDDEIASVLAAAGVPFGDVKAIRDQAAEAAEACVDAGLFSVAKPLVGVMLEAGRDDALADVYRSLVPTNPEG
jgi:tetratricopeptide (TPR) repeat protein